MVDNVEMVRATGRGKGKQIYQRLMRNTISNYAGAFFAIIVGFLMTPFLLHHLGVATFGIWMLVSTLAGYGRLFDFGIYGTVTKYVAEYRTTGEIEQGRRLISASMFLYSILGLALVGLSIAIAPLFPDLFNMPDADRTTAVRTVILMGVWVGLSVACGAPGAILQGLHRYDALNLVQSLGIVVSSAAMIAVLLLGGGIIGLALANIATTLASRSLMLLLVNRFAPELRPGWRDFDRASIRKVISFSSSIFMGQIAKRLQTKTDLIVIGIIMSVSSVTPYGIAWRLSEITRRIVTQFSRALLPMASELHAEGDDRRLRALYIMSVRLTLVISLAIGGVFIGLAGPFLTVWVGAELAEYSYLVTLLMLASIISLSQWPAGAILQGMDRYRLMAISAVISGLVNLALSIVLGLQFGLIGVALGTLIPTTIESFGFILPYTMRVLGIKLRDVIHDVLVPSLVPALPAAGLLYLLVHAIVPETWFEIAAIAAVSILVYVVGYLSVGASSVERSAYRSIALTTVRFAGAHLRRT
ncbi:oligosaccharide flippase family protein [soil metagenome]